MGTIEWHDSRRKGSFYPIGANGEARRASSIFVPSPSQALQVTLFGCPRIVQPQMSEPVALGRKTNELLALLLLHKHQSHHREKLAATLWSESDLKIHTRLSSPPAARYSPSGL